MIRVTYELEPPQAAETLALVSSVGLAERGNGARAQVVSVAEGRAVLEFPEENWNWDVTLLVSSLFAGEWADLAVFRRCRLVALDWTDGCLPGPAFPAPQSVGVGAIVKPSVGLSPKEAAATAAALAGGGAQLIKDDELMGDVPSSPLEKRVRAVVAAIPPGVVYAANVTGSSDRLLHRAARAVELGASAVMVNAFAQGLDAVRVLREADLGVAVFAHRVGAAFWMRNPALGVAGPVVCELTRLCGADYVQVGSFTDRLFDTQDDVLAQIDACHRPLAAAARSVAVLGGGVGPDNAGEQLRRSGAWEAVMFLLGSAAYRYPGGPEEAVRATVEAVSR